MKSSLGESPRFSVGVCGSAKSLEFVRKMLAVRDDAMVTPVALRSLLSQSAAAAPDFLVLEADNDDGGRGQAFEIRRRHPSLPVVAITEHPSHTSAVELMKLGVQEYVALPEEQRKLFTSIEAGIDAWSLRRQQELFLDLQRRTYDFSRIVGESPRIRVLLGYAQKVIENDYMTVLIFGETGTGKELLAKAIHYNSRNREHPFVGIPCSAIPETLLESELFGREKGAYTDAKERKIGLFELAGEGTLFLDEIGDISLLIQSKLLKVIEDKTMRRLGGIEDIVVRARIIAATSKNLEDLVKKGVFRNDLYYRLKILPLEVPPLRERRTDIPLLAQYFLQEFESTFGKKLKGFTRRALEELKARQWEGNVRELKHCIERAVVLAEDEWIDVAHFDFAPTAQDELRGQDARIMLDREPDDRHISLQVPLSVASLSYVEKLLIREVLTRVGGNKSRAAALLSISRPRLDRLISQDPDFFRPSR